MRALREAFPDHKLRIDPNGGWTSTRRSGSPTSSPTSSSTSRTRRPASRAWPPSPRETGLPLATNMCVIAFEHLAPAVRADAVGVVLSDHHLWGGLLRSRLLPASATRSGWACRCTRTATSASVSRR